MFCCENFNELSYQVARSPHATLPLTLPLVSDLFPGPRVVERLQIFSMSRMRLKKTKKTLAHTNLPKLVRVPQPSHKKVQTNVLDFLCFIIDIILPTTGTLILGFSLKILSYISAFFDLHEILLVLHMFGFTLCLGMVILSR